MGSLITALQNQNIAAANQGTLADLYAANPVNVGYTQNPFGYTAAPAVVQTAYPKYGINATAPMMPPSYEDYDLTTLFSMLQSMQAPQQDGQPQSFMAPVPTVAPMAEGQAPATPAGILAAMSAQPLSGAYRVPGTEPVVTEPEAEEEVVAAAAPEMSLGEYIRQGKTDPELLKLAQARSNYQLNPNISRDEASRIAYPFDTN